MLKYTHDEQGLQLEFDGSLLKLTAEATYLIRTIYERLGNQDKGAAEAFKEMMKRSIASDDSPVWLDSKGFAVRMIEKIKERFGIKEDV